MSALQFLHPEQTATAVRPSIGGDPRDNPPTEFGNVVVAVEDILTGVKQEPGGENVRIALRLWTEDMRVFRPGDVFNVLYLDVVEALAVEDPRRYPDHQQIRVVSRIGNENAGGES